MPLGIYCWGVQRGITLHRMMIDRHDDPASYVDISTSSDVAISTYVAISSYVAM